MNEQRCTGTPTWTCRQPALRQGPYVPHNVSEASPEDPLGNALVVSPMQTFVPGMVTHYLTHRDFPITKELAVLFVDLVNSTRMLSQQSPTQALALIQRFTELVTEVAFTHCDDVKDYEGDGALLYFASVAHATRAALAIRTALATLQTDDGQVIQARFSLNVGEVTIGVIGSALRRSVALIGPTVNLAARLLKHVVPGSIIAPQVVIEQLRQGAPTLAHDFQLHGKCLTVRDFEEQCVTAYSLPPQSPAPSVPSQKKVVSSQQSVISREQEGTQRPKVPDPRPLPLDSQCLLRREGDYWTVRFAGVTCHLKDSRGLHYIAHLLHHPHQEFHALTLAQLPPLLREGVPEEGKERHEHCPREHSDAFGDAGDLIDSQACAAYKQRLIEARMQLAEAQRFNDLGQIEKLQREIVFLTQELTYGLGLGGRARKAASIAERARINVTKAIKIALHKISDHHSELCRHLTTTLKTGTYCTYTPDVRLPITWLE